MRGPEELLTLYNQLKAFCAADLGIVFNLEDFKKAFEDMTQERLAHFLFRRIGHISDVDYFNFLALIKNPRSGVVNQTEEVPPIQKEVIQEPSTSEEDRILIEKLQNLPAKKRGRAKT